MSDLSFSRSTLRHDSCFLFTHPSSRWRPPGVQRLAGGAGRRAAELVPPLGGDRLSGADVVAKSAKTGAARAGRAPAASPGPARGRGGVAAAAAAAAMLTAVAPSPAASSGRSEEPRLASGINGGGAAAEVGASLPLARVSLGRATPSGSRAGNDPQSPRAVGDRAPPVVASPLLAGANPPGWCCCGSSPQAWPASANCERGRRKGGREGDTGGRWKSGGVIARGSCSSGRPARPPACSAAAIICARRRSRGWSGRCGATPYGCSRAPRIRVIGEGPWFGV